MQLEAIADKIGHLSTVTGLSTDWLWLMLYGAAMLTLVVVGVFFTVTMYAVLSAPARPHCHDCTVANRESVRQQWASFRAFTVRVWGAGATLLGSALRRGRSRSAY